MSRLAFLHTAEAHRATFGDLLARLAPQAQATHLVEESLLAEAMAAGRVTPGITARLAERLQAAAADADLVVCTCSTLGGPAEALGQELGLPVLRIDRAMAEQAVVRGGPILLAACIETTIGPTRDLLETAAQAAGQAVEIRTLIIPGAWEHFLAGDLTGYHTTIARGLAEGAGDAAVIVLAQASMAPAAALCGDLAVPILSSPELGLRQALDLASAG